MAQSAPMAKWGRRTGSKAHQRFTAFPKECRWRQEHVSHRPTHGVRHHPDGCNARRMRQGSGTRGTVAIRLSFSPAGRVPDIVQHKDNRRETVENRRTSIDYPSAKQRQALWRPRRKNIRKTSECLSTIAGSTAFSGTECRKCGGFRPSQTAHI